MKKKSVIFIEPSGNKANVFDNYMQLPLLGSLYLGTLLHNSGYQVKILNENLLSKKIDPFEIKADVFCITALTVTANRAKILISQLKKRHPLSTVIIGGIHASLLPEEFTDVADHVIVGEADEIIIDIIEGNLKDKIIYGSKIENLEALPLLNYHLIENAENMEIIPMMTSRGCPFDCNFCTVTKIFGRKFRVQSPQRIVSEIENALSCLKGKDFFFYDDNFAADRQRVSEFCDLILEKGIEINWFAQVRSDLAREPQLIEKMVRAGLKWVYIGFESINDETLKAFHKAQTKLDIEKAIKTFHQYGVNIHGMFMLGEDNDTIENISNTVQFAIDNEIDTVQFMILTPFPGTQCYDEIVKQGRLLHKNWDYYNAMFAVFQPKNMSAVTLINQAYQAYRKFYSIRRTLLDALQLALNIFLDALVWNFKRAKRYNLDAIFMRAGAKVIISKYSDVYPAYLEYLNDLEEEKLLQNKNRR